MTIIRRRDLLTGAAALVFTRAKAAEAPRDAALAALLDDLAAALKAAGDTPQPAAASALAALQNFGPNGLSPYRRREYIAVAAGLAREAAPGVPDYARRLALAFGAAVDPLEAHAVAGRSAAMLEARADLLLRGQGLMGGSVAERLRALAGDPRHLYPDDDAGRDRAVADMNRGLTVLRARLPVAFGALPMPTAEVRRMTREDEARGRAGYREAGAGVYYVDLKDIRARPRWSLPGVVPHETLPGHLLQLPLQAAARPHPLRLRYAGAFFEGWAVYAEQLADELGAYAGDPLAQVGALQWRLFRLARIVADTGLHALGWSREQAVGAMTELQGQSVAFITIEADADRIVAAPGRAAAEGLTALGLARLRDQARVRRGFGVARFHAALLNQGPWPFASLEAIVRETV